ncbi:MAG: ATP-binding cassette domain-containing protein [Ottowia sp.]
MPIIEIENVSKIYGQHNAGTVALQDVSLRIEKGELVALVGPSGCGKSTLLRLIADLDAPTKGSLTVNGQTPHAARLGRDYGFVFQSPTLYEWRSIVRNAELPLEVMGRPKREWRARVDKMLTHGRPARFSRPLPLAAFGRHAAARLDCARPLV